MVQISVEEGSNMDTQESSKWETWEREGYQTGRFSILPQTMSTIRDYIEHGYQPGSFLTAVICNDLKGTVNQADDNNIRNIPAFVIFLCNNAPAGCWGSAEKMKVWIQKKKEEREEYE